MGAGGLSFQWSAGTTQKGALRTTGAAFMVPHSAIATEPVVERTVTIRAPEVFPTMTRASVG